MSSPAKRVISLQPISAKTASCGCHGECHTTNSGSTVSPTTTITDSEMLNRPKVRYRIDNMDCPTEEQLIRQALNTIPEVEHLAFNLLARELTVYHRLSDTTPITDKLSTLGMQAISLDQQQAPPSLPPAISRQLKWQLAIGGTTAFLAESFAWYWGEDDSIWVIWLALISLLSAGLPTLRKGWVALRHRTINIYFLMSLAVIGAMIIGEWPEAAMVVFLFAVAEAIEARSLEQARQAIASVHGLAPEHAEVYRQSQWQTVPIGEIRIGETIRVRTGDRVPLDGQLKQGYASLNQAPITGESLPVEKQVGDDVYAASIVCDGVVEITVTADAQHSTLQRIAEAIQQAQSERAPTQRFVDQFARYYTPIIVLLAVLLALLTPLFGGDWQQGLYQALVMLVIACPCALVISTPVTVVSGLAAAARRGIFIKGGKYLELGSQLRAIAFDKTGTLTSGRVQLHKITVFAPYSEDSALLLAAQLAQHSSHPLSQAIYHTAKQQDGFSSASAQVIENFHTEAGRGISGNLDGQTYYLGKASWLQNIYSTSVSAAHRLSETQQTADSMVVLGNTEQIIAIFYLRDSLREDSATTITTLNGEGIHTVMLTGDHETSANHIATATGIKEVVCNLLPEEKWQAIAKLQHSHGTVGMVGDGINDAPALARADIGFAMAAAGTATALETADVAIMDDRPHKIVSFIQLSRHTRRVLKQNIFMALLIKSVFLLLAFLGHATLWMAVFADVGASLLVVLNGLRLLRYSKD
ncbi:heavy metal translocating P-type ATPase [Aquaspirillum serpens]|uniref:heavy metal translocating P-type ATPase n=1 Tax=Aquaspirillum serpens TaxID=190 RepID=UPI00041C5F25|nr:heavy metal translocating P-type ATPase [Aquaspirillum serpens]